MKFDKELKDYKLLNNKYKYIYFLGGIITVIFYLSNVITFYIQYSRDSVRYNLLVYNTGILIFFIISFIVCIKSPFSLTTNLIKKVQIAILLSDSIISLFFEYFNEQYSDLNALRLLISKSILVRGCINSVVYCCVNKKASYVLITVFILLFIGMVANVLIVHHMLWDFNLESGTFIFFSFLIVIINRNYYSIINEIINSKEKLRITTKYIKGILNNFKYGVISMQNDRVVFVNRQFKKYFASYLRTIKKPLGKLSESAKTCFLSKLDFFRCTNDPNTFRRTKDEITVLDQTFMRDMVLTGSGVELAKILKCNAKGISNSSGNCKFTSLGIFELATNPGEMKFFEVLLRRFELARKKVVIDFIINDITELKNNENEKTEAALKKNMFGKIAHEFKTPLITITSELEELEDKIKQMSEDKVYIDDISNIRDEQSIMGPEYATRQMNVRTNLNKVWNIEKDNSLNIDDSQCSVSNLKKEIPQIARNIKHLAHYTIFLINDIINYSNSNSEISISKRKIRFIKPIIDFSFNVMKALINYSTGQKSLIIPSLDVDEDIDNFFVISDDIRIKQILLNLVSNAIKFTSVGSVTLRCSVEVCSSIPINGITFTHLIKISVKDSGQGMHADLIAQIMNANKFHRLKSSEYNNSMGTGLGIGITKSLCEKLNFQFSCESEEGKGTLFQICIPAISKKSKHLSHDTFEELDKSLNTENCIGQTNTPIKNKELEDNEIILENTVNHIAITEDFVTSQKLKIGRKAITATMKKSSGKKVNIKSEMIFGKAHQEFSDTQIAKRQTDEYIIICDDSKIILDSLLRLLNTIIAKSKSNVEIIRVSDGLFLIDSILKCSIQKLKVRLVISDENMEYVNGSQAMEMIRNIERKGKFSKGIKYACLTAFEDDIMRQKILKSGFDFCLSKPASQQSLREILRSTDLI